MVHYDHIWSGYVCPDDNAEMLCPYRRQMYQKDGKLMAPCKSCIYNCEYDQVVE